MLTAIGRFIRLAHPPSFILGSGTQYMESQQLWLRSLSATFFCLTLGYLLSQAQPQPSQLQYVYDKYLLPRVLVRLRYNSCACSKWKPNRWLLLFMLYFICLIHSHSHMSMQWIFPVTAQCVVLGCNRLNGEAGMRIQLSFINPGTEEICKNLNNIILLTEFLYLKNTYNSKRKKILRVKKKLHVMSSLLSFVHK